MSYIIEITLFEPQKPPQWWVNLAKNSFGYNERDDILKKYHATVKRRDGMYLNSKIIIEFESEEYYTWFLLNIGSDDKFS